MGWSGKVTSLRYHCYKCVKRGASQLESKFLALEILILKEGNIQTEKTMEDTKGTEATYLEISVLRHIDSQIICS